MCTCPQLLSVVPVSAKTFNVTLRADAVSVFTWLEAGNVAGHFSDNGFLVTSPEVSLTFHAAHLDVTADELRDFITLTSLWDTMAS